MNSSFLIKHKSCSRIKIGMQRGIVSANSLQPVSTISSRCGVIGKVVRITADRQVMNGDTIDMSAVSAIAFDPYTHGYYKVTERVGETFKDGLRLKK